MLTKDTTREQIIDAASKRFSHFGYAKTTMAEIAMAAGLSVGQIGSRLRPIQGRDQRQPAKPDLVLKGQHSPQIGLGLRLAAKFHRGPRRRTGDQDQTAARELADALGGLPLALEQAAAYMQATGTILAGYLPLFQARQTSLLAQGQATGHGGTDERGHHDPIGHVVGHGVARISGVEVDTHVRVRSVAAGIERVLLAVPAVGDDSALFAAGHLVTRPQQQVR